ncbi:hypothetical protein HHK36_005199 [Tetracentron sinense]|uniref:Uncharacterized protein n=1 Tax=Tetracentron sinense TaxID=13715 RepID=A0A835DML2_TETSI|nr:hypothetical protein HHK36_005199 [Tetracentron sinense]
MPLSFSSPFHPFSLDLFFPMFFLSGKHLTPASVSLTSIFFSKITPRRRQHPPVIIFNRHFQLSDGPAALSLPKLSLLSPPPSEATRPSPPVRGSNFASVHPFRLFQLRSPLSPASSISMVASQLLQPSSPSNTSSLLR